MANINKIRLSGQTYNIEDVNASKTVELTQAQYDALTVKDPNTFYVITDAQGADLSNYYTKSETSGATEISTALAGKQSTLVSTVNIKTINNESILGSGNIDIQGGGKAVSGGTNISITTGETADTINCTLPISAGTGSNSIIMGYETNIASGNYSFAGGGGTSSFFKTSATKNNAFAFGTSVNANGLYSAVFGSGNNVEANGAFAAGSDNYIYGNFGVGFGYRVMGNNQSETSLGSFNVSNKSNTTFGDSGNTLFSVGNGTSTLARHNAFEIRQNGDIYLTKDGQDVKLQDQLGGSSITVDTALDSGSTNPVENKVIYNKIDEVEQVTARALNELNDELGGKQATLVSGTNIKTINNESILGSGNINIQGGSDINVVQSTGYSTSDVMSQDAVTYSIYMLEQNTYNCINSISGENNDEYFRFGTTNDYYYFLLGNAKINGRNVLNSQSPSFNEYNLVETSAITTSISSGSTNSQVPSAKAMYDKFDEVEQVTAAGLNALNDNFGGMKLVKLSQAEYNALATKDASTLYIIVN